MEFTPGKRPQNGGELIEFMQTTIDPNGSAYYNTGRTITVKPTKSGFVDTNTMLQVDIENLREYNVKAGVNIVGAVGEYVGGATETDYTGQIVDGVSQGGQAGRMWVGVQNRGIYDADGTIGVPMMTLQPGNIKKDINISGVTGTLDPGYQYYSGTAASTGVTTIANTAASKRYRVRFNVPSTIGTIFGVMWNGQANSAFNPYVARNVNGTYYQVPQNASLINNVKQSALQPVSGNANFLKFEVGAFTRVNQTSLDVDLEFSSDAGLEYTASSDGRWMGLLSIIHKPA